MPNKNPWITHLAKVRKENPKIKDVAKISAIAKKVIRGESKMPCKKYIGKQRALCFVTKEWKDWSKIKSKPKKK